ncbi:serine/threonine-protein kinase [Streptomyces sp. NPDC051636]|uniref:serine/threonine-protein kinase n=1 Tax=Streptomyces sp. NPDC051636 TaxID=3365663 RepID=UPI003792F123
MPVRLWSSGPESPLRGAVLAGRYRLDALLGRGGAADVHEAFDLQLRRPVAVKVFRAGGDTQTEERFAEEAFLLARLQHPGLVTVHDFGRERGRPFLVMELLKGSTLRARIASGPLPRAEVCVLGAALADALAHVHAAGVVHRDVKPSNILMDEAGIPHLTDFGISRLIDGTTRTATGALVGTAAYLAPEQVMGREVGPAADVYALGLTLLECLKGRLEYDGAPLEAAIARLHRPPVIPTSLDGDLSRLLRAMTARDESERPAADVCADVLTTLSPSGPRTVLRAGTYGTGRVDSGSVPAFAEERDPVATVAAPRQASALRRRSGRSLATAGAALAALLGVTLTGSIGDLSGSGSTTASGANGHGPTAPATEPSGTPSTPSDEETSPAPAAPAARVPKIPGTDSAPAPSLTGDDAARERDRTISVTTAAGPGPKSKTNRAQTEQKKASKRQSAAKRGKSAER